jgi:uncharacterized protein YdaU (DUF1376 family)
MAKDPAINWYFDNWDGGTKLMTRHQKGCYMDLLSAQFHSGPLSLENVKTVLGSDFQAAWPIISKKFTEENGLFFNERLEAERKKRIAYSESRSKNRKKKDVLFISNSYEKDMNNIPEIEIETGTDLRTKGGVEENWNQRPGQESLSLSLPEIKSGAVIELVRISKNITLSHNQVNSLWNVFKAQHFDGNKFYQRPSEVYTHFINWCSKKDIKDIQKNDQGGTQYVESLREKKSREIMNL